MLYDILFVLAIVLTRIVLPILVTIGLGSLLEHALRHGTHPA
jgi:hypothetical protein